MKLLGKVAIVTGGSRGIGLGCAKTFLKHGAIVAICSDNVQEGDEVVQKLGSHGKIEHYNCDVRDERKFSELIDKVVQIHGKLDCLINNAGWHPPARKIDQISVEEFEALIRLNLTSTFIGCKYAVPHLKLTKGSIINMASEVGLIGQADAVSYVASKAGQIGLTKALALDLAPEGVRVNAVCPAGVMTPMMREWAATQWDLDKALAIVDAQHPLGRMARPGEIGEVCAFLASEEASFVTGQAICPDGGAALGYRRMS